MKHTTKMKHLVSLLFAAGVFSTNASAADAANYINIQPRSVTNNSASVSGDYSVAIGVNTVSEGLSALAIGSSANAKGGSSIAIGANAVSTDTSSTAFGEQAKANGYHATSLGAKSSASAIGATAVGTGALSTGGSATAVGVNANASATGATALGLGSAATNGNAIALGTKANASAGAAVAVGPNAKASGISSVATGANADAAGLGSVASGMSSNAAGGASVALGRGASATEDLSVALGALSTTEAAVGTTEATVNGVTYSGFAGTSPVATVSVGSEGSERTITNVAAGRITADSTDAINGSQLYQVASRSNGNALAINNLNNRMDDMEDDLRAGIAGATALAFLQRPNEAGKSMVSAAVGGFRDQQALAIGYARNSDNNKWSIKAGVGVNTQKDVNWGGSVGYQW